MVNSAVRGFVVFGLVAVAAAFSFGIFIQNSSGQFLEILRLGESGVKVMGLAFIPLGLYLAYKSV